jgi:hypothetical protein
MLRLRLHQAAGRKTGPSRQIAFGKSPFTRAIRRLPYFRNRMAAVHRRIVLAKDEEKDEYDTYLHIMMRQFVP